MGLSPPPALEPVSRHILIEFNSMLIADTRRAIRVLETSHPPVYYIPPQDIQMNHLKYINEVSWCEWKGEGHYYSVVVGKRIAEKAAWFYPDPFPRFQAIKDYIAFYAGKMDRCSIDGEEVQPQPGEFYGGWITDNIKGPFKGVPGSWGW